ncbi:MULTISPECIES: VRR-NUC domain-containing protein [Halomonadaceae]|uniref:VRR-NUC domain-containing protein n=1 Tax=Halomonadaceae TaxID=28256 RepID=UPI001582FEE9|nr:MULTISPECIES: VRR-NUC domain-containing protein [Halomonas]MDI4639084.1 VRR-NUC domain-containing protein [Halomonas sp. BMC7]NUJ60075.1 VRR-NUC domain-containing protein [Halomonas taeanensis]
MNSSPPAAPVTASLDDPRYYLTNFRFVLDWVVARYGDLLSDEEHATLTHLGRLPSTSLSLLTRMVMRKGHRFRLDKLRYAEIGDTRLALAPLIQAGLVDDAPRLELAELFGLATLGELRQWLCDDIRATGLPAGASKARLLEALAPALSGPRLFTDWGAPAGELVVELTCMALCERLRLMFFGNLRQGFSEFVLAELGHQRFEQVSFSDDSRAFQARHEVDTYLALEALRERLEAGESPAALWPQLPGGASGASLDRAPNAWLEARRGRLVFRLAREAERQGDSTLAAELYPHSNHPEARVRALRLAERRAGSDSDREAILAAVRQALTAPRDAAEAQALVRLETRLARRLGRPTAPRRGHAPERFSLVLPASIGRVEYAVRDHLTTETAPVHYVENTLVTGLFGLLCWPAIFAPLPGAFFHPFHTGPADLNREDFVARRRRHFDDCLATLEDGRYLDILRARFEEKQGLASPFVHWGVLDAPMLEQALACIPARHLRVLFERLLEGPRANRAGLPDLIQFSPEEKTEPRYRLIEVKGPGDRLQDNQRRWLAFFAEQGVPAAVCEVRWDASVEASESALG